MIARHGSTSNRTMPSFSKCLRTCHQLWRKTAFHFLVPNIGSYRFFRVHASVCEDFFGFEVLSCPFHLNTPNDWEVICGDGTRLRTICTWRKVEAQMGPTELFKKVVCAPLLLRSLDSLVVWNYDSPFFLAAFYEISMFWFDFLVLSVNVLRYFRMKSGPQISIPHIVGWWRFQFHSKCPPR